MSLHNTYVVQVTRCQQPSAVTASSTIFMGREINTATVLSFKYWLFQNNTCFKILTIYLRGFVFSS